MTNTVMNPSQPRFKVQEHEMDNRQILFGNLWIAALGDVKVFVPKVFEVVITPQSSVIISVPGLTDFSTKPQSDFALRSGATASLTRQAYRPPLRLMVFAPGLRCRTSTAPVTRTLS